MRGRRIELPRRRKLLQLRPNCEYCDADLPPDAQNARICSYECTFCAECALRVLRNVCPNCGGGFVPRPVRPATERRPGVCLARHPPSGQRVHLKWERDSLSAYVDAIASIPPERR